MCRRLSWDFGESDQSRAAFDVRRPFKLNISALPTYVPVLLHITQHKKQVGNKRGTFIWAQYLFILIIVICYLFNQIINRCREEGDRRGTM